jgi:hypothetical protein
VDHGDMDQPRKGLAEVIENLVEAESTLLLAQAVMLDSSLSDRPGYRSIVENISAALASTRGALAEAHHKLHEP